MKIIWFFLIFVGSLCPCAEQASKNIAELASAKASKERNSNLDCSISAQSLEWRSPPVEVSAVIENRSKNALGVPVVPAFVLKPSVPTEESLKAELSYQALWDLGKKTSLPVFSTVFLQLKPGDSRKITVDISKLLWSRMNSSVLPHSKLFEAVPAANYSLRLELTGKDGRVLCSSNAVDILIK